MKTLPTSFRFRDIQKFGGTVRRRYFAWAALLFMFVLCLTVQLVTGNSDPIPLTLQWMSLMVAVFAGQAVMSAILTQWRDALVEGVSVILLSLLPPFSTDWRVVAVAVVLFVIFDWVSLGSRMVAVEQARAGLVAPDPAPLPVT